MLFTRYILRRGIALPHQIAAGRNCYESAREVVLTGGRRRRRRRMMALKHIRSPSWRSGSTPSLRAAFEPHRARCVCLEGEADAAGQVTAYLFCPVEGYSGHRRTRAPCHIWAEYACVGPYFPFAIFCRRRRRHRDALIVGAACACYTICIRGTETALAPTARCACLVV